MNDEIKEILDYLKEFIDEDRLEQINLNRWFVSSLLDYITNLQQEIEHLDKVNCQLRKKINNDIYKSRIEKAVEYIKEQYKWIEESDERWQPVLDNKKILNILNGDKSE